MCADLCASARRAAQMHNGAFDTRRTVCWYAKAALFRSNSDTVSASNRKNTGSSALWRVTVERISPYDSRGHSWRTPQIHPYRAQVGAAYGARCVVMSSRGLWRFGYATRVHDIGNAMAGTGQAPPAVVIPCAAANPGLLLRNSARRCGSCRQARPRLACRAVARCLRPGHCHAARRRYGHWRDT